MCRFIRAIQSFWGLGLLVCILSLTAGDTHSLQAQTTARTVDIVVQPQQGQQTISPHIYGMNYHPDIQPLLGTMNLTGARIGGNRASGGNWENNASYSGTDLVPPQTDWFACYALGYNYSHPKCAA